MQWTYEVEGNRLTVRIAGEIDHHAASDLKAELDKICRRERIKHIILDLSMVDFMDSAGIGLIISRYRYTSGQGGKTVACGVGETLRRILSFSGLGRNLPVYSIQEEAKQSI